MSTASAGGISPTIEAWRRLEEVIRGGAVPRRASIDDVLDYLRKRGQGRELKGLIQVYTGKGKGKTTAALGLALRAVGQGMQVRMIQFVKNVQGSGEVKMAGQLPGFSLEQFGTGRFVKGEPGPADREKALPAGWEAARESLQGDYDLVILDEISHVLNKGLLSVEEVLGALRERSPRLRWC